MACYNMETLEKFLWLCTITFFEKKYPSAKSCITMTQDFRPNLPTQQYGPNGAFRHVDVKM